MSNCRATLLHKERFRDTATLKTLWNKRPFKATLSFTFLRACDKNVSWLLQVTSAAKGALVSLLASIPYPRLFHLQLSQEFIFVPRCKWYINGLWHFTPGVHCHSKK
jgi:hypothetical protein